MDVVLSFREARWRRGIFLTQNSVHYSKVGIFKNEIGKILHPAAAWVQDDKSERMLTKEKIIEELETIHDPEVNLDIYTMGLIYDITSTDDGVHILMTYTTPACPAGPIIQNEIRDSLVSIGAKNVTIEITFNPPWKAPQNLRTMMGV